MKQIIILSLIVCVSILAGFLPSKEQISILFEYTGYYFISASFLLWVFYLLKLYSPKLKNVFVNHYSGLCLSVVLVSLIFCIAPPKFKVLSDETNLIGISMAMYQSKKASLPLRGFNPGFQKPEYTSKVDKRPILFSFLVSLVHSLLGYSAFNGFVVNFICGILALFLIYLFLYDFFPRTYALISILLVASLPNFVIWVTSSGFETLNLFFIVLTLFLFNKVITTKSVQHAELFFLTLVLVSQCRYESIFFAVGILFLLPMLLDKKSITEFSFITYLVPVLFVPTIWLPRLYAGRPIIDKMAEGYVHAPSLFGAFSISHLITNTSKNLTVFLGFDPHLGFSPVIAVLTLAGLYLMIRKMIVAPQDSSLPNRTTLIYGALTVVLIYCLQGSFYLGDMIRVTQNRFAMAFLPYMIFPAIFCIHKFFGNLNPSKKILVWIIFAFHLLYFWPYGAQQMFFNRSTIPYEFNNTLTYLKNNFESDEKILVICERPNLYIVHCQGALDFKYANQNPNIILNMATRDFEHILVLQKYLYETQKPLESHRLSSSYRLVPLKNINLTQTEYLKISRIN
jgi:hypothetical protein